jgi:energy-coupling factor transporter ATP-binding protein EcfA2
MNGNPWWDNIVHFVSTWGPNNLVGIIVTACITSIVFSFRKIIDFLSKIAQWVSAIVRKDRKYYKFEKAYLTWIINQHRYLGLLPARIVTDRWGERRGIVDLEKVYVTLQVSAQGGDQDGTEIAKDTLSWRKQPWFYFLLKYYRWTLSSLLILNIVLAFYIIIFHSSSYFRPTAAFSFILPLFTFFILILLIRWRIRQRREETYRLGDLGLVIHRQKQLVIRGDPGSGKTTLLRYLAVTCARALRDDKKQGDSSDLVKKRLLWSVRPFPILVTLRRLNDLNIWDQKKQLIDAFFEEMPVELRKRYPEGFFEQRLHRGNCLILLDAFDELGSPEARSAVARRIGDFLNFHHHAGNRVVVTTRIVGYEGQLDQYDFQIRTVQNLNAGEIRALIKQRYRGIALSETYGWQAHDATPILQDMRQRSERLIKKIESTPRLVQLATNPLLLSLIVLVHYVKVELPEQRVLLYRDCVEILTEQWQRAKKAEIDMVSNHQEDLTLPQKLGLLQELALAMQKQREEENRQTLLPRIQAQKIIASKLSDIIGNQLPTTEPERQEMCQRKAEAWIAGIQVESGILVEQGLDEAGNPLIGFSHLTFQEYLAAVAINEDPHYQPLLRSNLLQPAWSEVVLLYIALTNDATATIAHLLDVPAQPAGVLLAGYCLAERVRQIKNQMPQLTIEKLKAGFEQANSQTIASFGQVLTAIGGDEVTTFMRGQLQSTMMEKRLEAVKALGHIKIDDPQIKNAQQDLVTLVETPNDVNLVIAAREALAQIGDPRFIGKEPILVSVPQQSLSISSSPKGWKELVVTPEWINAQKILQKFPLITRVFDYWVFTKVSPLRQKQAFEISKYLVTNTEYARFVEATGHRIPKYWIEGTFPIEKATHPVTGITPKEAKEYCKWLSGETGKVYRLPTEWEWEWAATGPQGQRYPWGDQFDKNMCNTKEAAIGETTPVGSYLAGISQYGITDMSGNIWEITQGCISSTSLFVLELFILSRVLKLNVITSLLILLLLVIDYFSGILEHSGFLILKDFEKLGYLGATGTQRLLLTIFLILLIFITSVILKIGKALEESGRTSTTLRGGAFNTSSDQVTCFSRKKYSYTTKEIGFRCIRDV